MDIFIETTQISVDNGIEDCKKTKNILTETYSEAHKPKKLKLCDDSIEPVTIEKPAIKKHAINKSVKVPQSPKKRLQLGKQSPTKSQKDPNKFIYGNYSQYYGYRNKGKDFHDVRLDVFAVEKQLICGKQVLDIGCNSGLLTMELAKRFDVKSIVGLDIDRSLINQANKQLIALKKSKPINNPDKRAHRYPYNVTFVHGNYVLKDDVLLQIERSQFDVLLCLSITKWIHLNFGDAGLKQAFRRMYLQLRDGGKLILEAQPFDNYGRRKKMTETINANYTQMQFFPKDFTEYLLSSEVGFASVKLLGVPEHCAAGFKRPIQVFSKN